jgi:hypothetical protein
VAVANGANGVIYISTNSGSGWTATSAPRTYWFCVASSADGTNLVAAIAANGGIYVSTNAGNTWTRQTNAPNSYWWSVASSSDGTKLVAVDGDEGGIYTGTVIYPPPSITNQPQSLTVTNGHSATFNVGAEGSLLTYQWIFNATNLSAATNATLTMQNVFPVNAGAYAVIVTNAFGSVTSNPAILTLLPLVITSPTLPASGQFQFSFDTATGVSYAVQCSTNLMQWFPL